MTPQLPRTHGSSFFAEMHHVIMKIMCGKKKGKGITMKKHIYILATGGTIAGKAASEAATTGYEAGAIGIADLLAAVSEVRQYADVVGADCLDRQQGHDFSNLAAARRALQGIARA